MTAFLARRTLALLLTAWLASVVVFAALEAVPGDAASMMLGTEARPDTLAALRHQLGLDRPVWERYGAFAADLLRGRLGTSLTYGRPVAALVGERLAVTLPLAVLALALSTVIALPLGLWAAARRGRAADWGVMGFAQLGIAVPGFWCGILLILLFAVTLGWLPAGGFPGWAGGPGPALKALLLPALALALPEAAVLARVARTAVLDTLGEDFIRSARAKGAGGLRVLWRHALPNALVPVTTLIGLQFAFLVGGAVVIENVFTLPGLGRLLYQAVGQRDVVVVRDVVLLLALLVIAVNLLVDVIQAALDPRPRVNR